VSEAYATWPAHSRQRARSCRASRAEETALS
jgi:hypothetical protein